MCFRCLVGGYGIKSPDHLLRCMNSEIRQAAESKIEPPVHDPPCKQQRVGSILRGKPLYASQGLHGRANFKWTTLTP